MHKSKLVQLLQILTPTEFKAYAKFIKSPFFNTNKNLPRFYAYCQKYYPDFDTPKMNREVVYKKLFPGKKYNYHAMGNLMSEFTTLTEEYLTNLQFQKNKFEKKNRLIKAYGERNAYSLFEKETQNQLEEIRQQPFRDVEYYGEVARLNFDYYFHTLTEKHNLKDEALEQLMESIDREFMLAKLRIGSELKSRERMLKQQYDIPFLAEILENKNAICEQTPVLELFHLLFKLYEQSADDAVFFQLKNLYTNKIQQLRRLDQSLLLTQLINYAARQINFGKTTFYQECLDLYKLGLTYHLVLENQRIDEAVYGNIALLGCHAKDFEWTEKFIEEYAIYLREEQREDAKALAKGTLFFHQNDFEQAYQLFYNHSFSHYYQPKARLYLIRVLYEQFLLNDSLFDLIIAKIESFEAFLYRNEILAPKTKEAYLNGIKVIKKMILGKNDKREIEGLKNWVNGEKRILIRSWLNKKLNGFV